MLRATISMQRWIMPFEARPIPKINLVFCPSWRPSERLAQALVGIRDASIPYAFVLLAGGVNDGVANGEAGELAQWSICAHAMRICARCIGMEAPPP